MKIEVLAARHTIPLRDRLVAAIPRIAPWAARAPWLFNLRNNFPPLRKLGARIGIAAERALPVWHSRPFRDDEGDGPNGDVFLFADTFNRAFEPDNLRAALRVLRAAGKRVTIASDGGPSLCCGRTQLAAGMVDQARITAARTLAALAGDAPVLGLEPSCLFTLKDEFLSILPGPATTALAGRVMLISEYLAREKPSLTLKPIPLTAHIHGHCHQKSFGAFPAAVATLKTIPGLTVKPIAASCCGMAGAFGYQSETQEISRAMAEAGLLPAVRAAAATDLIVADGTSCRHQIADLTGRKALHSIRLLEMAL